MNLIQTQPKLPFASHGADETVTSNYSEVLKYRHVTPQRLST